MRIAFTGDVAFTNYFSNSCKDNDLLSDEIVSFLSKSQYNVVNVEGAVSSKTSTVKKDLVHSNPPECIEWFKKTNGNIWNVANNHIMDCGDEGFNSTLNIAKDNGFLTVGAGKNINEAQKPIYIYEAGGVGIIAVTYSTNNAAKDTPGCFVAEEEQIVKKQIEEVKNKCRWCVVVSHVGQEFSQIPMPFVRDRYKRYLKYGADIIIGHHPHVIQNYEKIGEKIVFYSLGNFIFDTDYQRIQKYTDHGMLVAVDFEEDKYSWEYMPIKICRERQIISPCEVPKIFRNIKGFEYGLLWPLAARQLSINIKKKKNFLHPEFRERSWLDWLLKYDIRMCKKILGRNILLGRLLSVFCFWKLANKDIVKYIEEK